MRTLRHGLAVVFALSAFGTSVNVRAEEEIEGASGFNLRRIEQEDKISVPVEDSETAWKTLLGFLVEDKAFLGSLGPAFTSNYATEDFTDIYYDTPDFEMAAIKSGVRRRKRVNLSDPTDRKSGRELMQIKINSISDNPMERGEIKFPIREKFGGSTPDDNHVLLGHIEPEHREGFVQRVQELGIDPWAMKPILDVRDYRRRIYIFEDGKPFMSLSLDRVRVERFGETLNFTEIEPELNEIGFAQASPQKRKYMEEVLGKVLKEVYTRIPTAKQDLTPKYTRSVTYMRERIPDFRERIVNEQNFEAISSLPSPTGAQSSTNWILIGSIFAGLILALVAALMVVRKNTQRGAPAH